MRDQATWRAPGGSLRIPYLLTLIVAALLIVSSVAGLLFGQRGLYQPEPRMLAAFMSQDVISLIVGLPLLLGSLWLARRGSARGLLLWLGTLFYIAYGYAYYVFAAPFGVLFFVYVALVALSLYSTVWALLTLRAEDVRSHFRAATPVRAVASYLLGIALIFSLMWTTSIVVTLASGAEIDPVLRLVASLDFIAPLPSMLIGGLLLWRRHAWGYVVGGMMLVKATFYGLTLAGTALALPLWGAAPDPLLPVYFVLGLGGLAASIAFFRHIGSGSIAASDEATVAID